MHHAWESPVEQESRLSGSHLTVHDVAAYLDGAVEAATREGLEAHLAGCDACLGEVISTARILWRGLTPRP